MYKSAAVLFLTLILGPPSTASLQIFTVENCKLLWTSSLPGIASMDMSGDGHYLAVGSSDNSGSTNPTVSFFARDSSQPLWTRKTSSGLPGPDFVSISQDGRYVAVGGTRTVTSEGIHVFGSDGASVFSYNPPVTPNNPYGSSLASIAISGDGRYLGVVDENPGNRSVVFLFALPSNQSIWSYNMHTPYAFTYPGIVLSYEGGYMTTLDNSYLQAYFFSQYTNKTLWTAIGYQGGVKISENGDFILIQAYRSNNLTLFQKASNQSATTFKFQSSIVDFAISSDGSTIAALVGKELFVYDRATGAQLFTAFPDSSDRGAPSSVKISRDGSRIVVGSVGVTQGLTSNHGLLVFGRTGQQICSLRDDGETGFPLTTASSADGTYLADGGGATLFLFSINPPSISPYFIGLLAAAVSAAAVVSVFFLRRRRTKAT